LLNNPCDWLQKKIYLKAVKIIVEAKAFSEDQLNDGRNAERGEADMGVQSLFGHYSGQKEHGCPLELHDNYAKNYNYDECADITRVHGAQYDDPTRRLTLVLSAVFDETVCVNQAIR